MLACCPEHPAGLSVVSLVASQASADNPPFCAKMATQSTRFLVPVYPLVLKFLSYHYPTDPFEITRVTNPVATYLYACLDRYDHRDTDTMLPRKYERLSERLVISIAGWRVKMYGSGHISPRKVSAFNDFVRQLFIEKLTHEVSLHMAFGMGLRDATERFLTRYGITEDDLPIDTALRYFARHRRRTISTLACCPETPPSSDVPLPHERDRTQWQMESRRRQVA